MTPDEHLDAICAHIRNLLAICDKRTPGEWKNQFNHNSMFGPMHQVMQEEQPGYLWAINGLSGDMGPNDATFIAATAGNFERALRSTLAAIDGLRKIVKNDADALKELESGLSIDDLPGAKAPIDALDAIRTEWPEARLAP